MLRGLATVENSTKKMFLDQFKQEIKQLETEVEFFRALYSRSKDDNTRNTITSIGKQLKRQIARIKLARIALIKGTYTNKNTKEGAEWASLIGS